MIFATADFSFKSFFHGQSALYQTGLAFLLNYVIFGSIVLGVCFWVFPGSELWIGCVLLVASPPGPSVVPFTAIMKGNVTYGVIGLFGLHILAIVLAPLLMLIFTGMHSVDPLLIVVVLVKTVIIPIILSRPLRHRKVYSSVQRMKGKVINWGFFLIIIPIVGQSKSVMIQNPDLIFEAIIIFIIAMFVSAFLFYLVTRKMNISLEMEIPSMFFLTTKSSAFAAVVVFSIGNDAAGIPSAVHAFFVTLFFLGYSALTSLKTNRKQIVS